MEDQAYYLGKVDDSNELCLGRNVLSLSVDQIPHVYVELP